jgi:cytochrome c
MKLVDRRLLDVSSGKELFERRCASCHALDTAEPSAGPDLHGVFGRRAGSLPKYPYSPAMRASGQHWSRETLDRYLAAPRKMIPGTSMLMTVPEATERAALIDYLQTLSKPKK